MTPLSVLDLIPIVEGGDAASSFRNAVELAQHAERWNYNRYWVAEHHGMPGIASAATAVVLSHIGDSTSRIRIGAGGIMLPNHAPLVIAEQFGTLESLFPGRVDLGLGRAPGSDPKTAQALRRNLHVDVEEFPNDVLELMRYFHPDTGNAGVRAIPGEGLNIPLWILGSSLFGAHLAAELGLPYAFASHFAPAQMMEAIETYRHRFRPSEKLAKPYLMLGFHIFAADTDAEASWLASSMQQAFVNLRSGRPSRLKPPQRNYLENLTATEHAILEQTFTCAAIGSPETVRRQTLAFLERTGADELMITSQIFDHVARLRSYEIAARVLQSAH